MKRLIAILAAIIVTGALLVSAPALLVSSDAARGRIEAQLSVWFGARVRVGAPPRISVVPRLSLVLEDVSLEGNGWSLKDAGMRARLDLSALLSGTTRLASLAIANPQIRISAPFQGRPETAVVVGRAVQRILRHPLSVANADVYLDDATEPLLRDMVFQLAPGGEGATLRGGFKAADQQVEATVTLADTAVLTGEGAGNVTVSLASSLATLRIDGMVGEGGAPRLSGDFEFSTSDLRGLAGRLGVSLIGDTAFGVARLTGIGSASVSAIELDTARVELDGNIGEGRLALSDRALRPRLEGTLAFERLDLSAYLQEWGGLPKEDVPGPDWVRAPLFQLLSGIDVDLRLSAARLVAAALETGPSALSLLLRDGDLSINLSETTLAGGSGALTVRARPEAESGYVATAMLIGEDLALAELALSAPDDGPRIAAGYVSGRMDVNARGATLAQLARSYRAVVAADAKDVELRGGDLDAVMDGLLAGDMEKDASSVSRFETIAARLELDADALQVSELDAMTARHRLSLSGRVARAKGGVSLRGEVAERRAEPVEAGAPPAKAMPVLVRGTLTAPRLLPDMTGLSGSPTR